jgi:hypothetical protein
MRATVRNLVNQCFSFFCSLPSSTGPRKAGFFLDNPHLYDPNTTDTKPREYIFSRIRAPVKKGDKQNEALRDKQAYMYWMPRLGGDNSKCNFSAGTNANTILM